MTRRRGIWAKLGVDPTGDERAIKRAYASKLKALDVEADPAAFIALRAALDQALREADWRRYKEERAAAGDTIADDDDDDDDDEDDADIADAVAPEALRPESPASDSDEDPAAAADPPRPPLASPWEVEEDDRVERHLDRVAHLLEGPDAGRDAALDVELRTLWADPALGGIDAEQDVEHRLAHMIMGHGQEAAFLLQLASWHYGWARRAGQVGLNWPISEVANRAAAERWLDRIADGTSPDAARHARAYAALRRAPSTSSWRNRRDKAAVQRLLAELRVISWDAEHRFDPDHRDAWLAAPVASIPWMRIALILFAGYALSWLLQTGDLVQTLSDWRFWLSWGGVILYGFAMRRIIAWRNHGIGGRRRDPLRAGEAAALAGLLAVFVAALWLPPSWPLVVVWALVASALTVASGVTLPEEGEAEQGWEALVSVRYLAMAGGLFTVIWQGVDPDWWAGVVPGLLAVLSFYLMHDRLVATWQALPRSALLMLRGAMLLTALSLCWAVWPPEMDPDPALWLAVILLLVVQDAALDARMPPFATRFYIAYILLVLFFLAMPAVLALALVSRRAGDRLYRMMRKQI